MEVATGPTDDHVGPVVLVAVGNDSAQVERATLGTFRMNYFDAIPKK